jgi:cytochrome P450
MTDSKVPPPAPPGHPFLGHTAPFVSDTLSFIRDSVETTGDIFRLQLLGKDLYVAAHPDQAETVLLDRNRFGKPDDFMIAFGESVLSVEGEQWQRQRQAMDSFFSPTRLQEFVGTMNSVTDARTERWATGESIRLDEEMRMIALQNLFEVILGRSIGDGELDELAEIANGLNSWFKPTSWALPNWVPTPARYRFRRSSDELRERAEALLTATGSDPDSDSLLAMLASLRDDPDSAFDRSEVLDQVVGMLFAGHETTALAMTYTLHQIGSHPDVAEQFHAELDATIDGQPSVTDLQELDYFEQVINEGLRLYPPVHAIPRVATQQVELSGHTIPADELLMISIWSLHRDPRFYDDPLTFDPSRWQQTTPRERGYAFIPFGAGPRICIGRHFARLELKATLASIGSRFDFESEGDIELAPQMTTQPAGPVRIRLRERDENRR